MPSQFYFAWVEPSETTFELAHHREDEQVFGLAIAHAEGEFPTAQVRIRNPHVGLLGIARKRWAWIAWDDGEGTVTPLFFGRMVGIPSALQGEVIALDFIARPIDWDEQRRALGAALKVAPYWDDVWIQPDRREDPDSFLEARSARWHVDRLTHVVTASDIIVGEAGLIDLAGDHIYDGLDVSLEGAPARRVRCSAQVFWQQQAVGEVDLSAAIRAKAKAVGSGNGQNIDTYTGEGLARDWPEPGDPIGGDWEVGESHVLRGNGLWVPVESERVLMADASVVDIPSWSFRPVFKAHYEADRSRSETVTFTLEADVQAVLTEPGDEDEILLTMRSSEIAEPIDDAGSDGAASPIFDVRRASYFKTDRGRQSLEYLLSVARAQLLARARVARISARTRWSNGLALTCRHNVRLEDPRLPGGEAIGKVIAYQLAADGNTGALSCEITIACALGRGETVSPSGGDPDYVADGYVATGYQTYTGQEIAPIAGELTYVDFSNAPIDDDGVNLFAMTPAAVLQAIEIFGTKGEQRAILRAFRADMQAALDALDQVHTEIYVELVPLNTGPFETAIAVAVSDLMVPKTIDLEAA